MTRRSATLLAASLLLQATCTMAAELRPRARDLGLPLGGEPGVLDAITDVAGVEVGYTTLLEGDGSSEPGTGPVRTGVTLVFPRGRANLDPVFGAWHSFNGNGEMTGTAWLAEGGLLEGPVAITNTHSVGVVRDEIVRWEQETGGLPQLWQLPVVAETWDGGLNDIDGMHVKPAHVRAAIASARGAVVPAEGNVGGGTGMVCFEFKGGTGTASRRAEIDESSYTVGVLVQCNTGRRADLRIAGVPVGDAFADRYLPCRTAGPDAPDALGVGRCGGARAADVERGSIIVVVATDAPLLPHQLRRVAQRATVGLARAGGFGGNGSGDIFVAFSTANAGAARASPMKLEALGNDTLSPLFKATALATEAAIVNALLQARDMDGIGHRRVHALPWQELAPLFRIHGYELEPFDAEPRQRR